MNNKTRTVVLTFMFMLGIILITAGSTLAFFQYKQNGTSYSTITADSITFHYKEVDGKGHGISITDAMPVVSNVAARSAGTGFNFKITAKSTTNVEIPYTVTAKLNSGSASVMGDIVETYLTEVGASETPTSIYSSGEVLYNELSAYTVNGVTKPDEKVILTTKVPANTANYSKDYRFRIWIDENADFSEKCSVNPTVNTTPTLCTAAEGTWGYQYNDKEFSVTLNVYATGAEPENIPDENRILKMTIENRPMWHIYSGSTSKFGLRVPEYANSNTKELMFPDRNIDIEIITEYDNADIEIIQTDANYQPLAKLDIQKSNVVKISKINAYTIHYIVEVDEDIPSLTTGTYNAIINLRSKNDSNVIYDTAKIEVYTEFNTGYYEDDGKPWATWFINDGRDTWCENCDD